LIVVIRCIVDIQVLLTFPLFWYWHCYVVVDGIVVTFVAVVVPLLLLVIQVHCTFGTLRLPVHITTICCSLHRCSDCYLLITLLRNVWASCSCCCWRYRPDWAFYWALVFCTITYICSLLLFLTVITDIIVELLLLLLLLMKVALWWYYCWLLRWLVLWCDEVMTDDPLLVLLYCGIIVIVKCNVKKMKILMWSNIVILAIIDQYWLQYCEMIIIVVSIIKCINVVCDGYWLLCVIVVKCYWSVLMTLILIEPQWLYWWPSGLSYWCRVIVIIIIGYCYVWIPIVLLVLLCLLWLIIGNCWGYCWLCGCCCGRSYVNDCVCVLLCGWRIESIVKWSIAMITLVLTIVMMMVYINVCNYYWMLLIIIVMKIFNVLVIM